MRCPNPRFVWPNGTVIAVPCGKCLFCLQNKRNDWSMRLMQEHRYSTGAMFVTLTYNEKFVPSQGVVKRHLQLFFKRLRKRLPDENIRYYAVGEYGGKTLRPHYHIILFNCSSQSVVRDSWQLDGRPIGLVHIGQVTEASIRYCTKYVIQKGSPIPGLNLPFALMSRRYGLGLSYITDAMLYWHRCDDRNYTVLNGQKQRLPRYYKEKIWPDVKDFPYVLRNGEIYTISDWASMRTVVADKALAEAELREQKEIQFLESEGYNANAIRTEMRNAVYSRIKTKVAYTQHL